MGMDKLIGHSNVSQVLRSRHAAKVSPDMMQNVSW